MPSQPATSKSKRPHPRQVLQFVGGAIGGLFLIPAALLPFAPKSDLFLLFAALLWAWKPFALALLLCATGLVLALSSWPGRKKWPILLAGSVALLWIGKDLRDNCYLAALAGEDDQIAEISFNTLNRNLSDSRIDQLFADRDLDDNVRFYLAVIATNRGLEFLTDPLLGKPGAMAGNRYLEIAQRIHFPIRYSEFVKAYREQEKNPASSADQTH